MEKLTKLKLRVVSSTALLIFAIFGFLSVSGSLAWFSSNKQVTSNGMVLQSVTEDLKVAGYEIYYYDVENSVGALWADETKNAFLREYDSVFTDRNENTSLIFKIPVQGPYIREGKAFTVTLDCTQALYERDSEGAQTSKVADYLSNVVQIKASAIASLTNETDADTIYTQATNHFKTVENNAEQAFVLVSENTATKNVAITFTIENYGEAESLDLYIEMDYSPELIKYYLGHRNGNVSGSGWIFNEVTMANDVSRISLGILQE